MEALLMLNAIGGPANKKQKLSTTTTTIGKSESKTNQVEQKVELTGWSKCTTMLPKGWHDLLAPEFKKSYFQKLMQQLDQDVASNKTVYPPIDQVFSAFDACDLQKVQVVILGQDCYHGPKQAHGLCFSVQQGIAVPPSLQNIYKELQTDLGSTNFTVPKHGYLLGWAKQGVLMLNSGLTVRAHEPNSHKDFGWATFTDQVIRVINQRCTGVVFLLWGSFAKSKASLIDTKRHHCLFAAHPSPFSAQNGFFGCKHFSKTNGLLIKQNKKPIDWQI